MITAVSPGFPKLPSQVNEVHWILINEYLNWSSLFIGMVKQYDFSAHKKKIRVSSDHFPEKM